ncbi:protein FD-like [Papaver somniferum]|uniref:protein FD-like n=1 Tax=Papaver somniferum TaxID=3469 RepID=UPI000E6FD800|nr:protein FD-like [Papaver somniferum]
MDYPSSYYHPSKGVVCQEFNPYNSQFCLAKQTLEELEEDYLMKTDVRAATANENNPTFMSNINSGSSSSSSLSPPTASDSVNINQNGEVLAWDNYKVKTNDLIRGVEGCAIKSEVFSNEYNNNIYNPQPLMMNGGIMPQPIPELLSFQMVESTAAIPVVEQKWGGFMECLSGVSGPTFVNQPPPDANGYMDNRGYVDNRLSHTLPMPMNGTNAKAMVVAADKVDKKSMEKTMERRQKRMIKNRESAARSRARKQAHTNQLEHRVAELTKMNERLHKENGKVLVLTSVYMKKYLHNVIL